MNSARLVKLEGVAPVVIVAPSEAEHDRLFGEHQDAHGGAKIVRVSRLSDLEKAPGIYPLEGAGGSTPKRPWCDHVQSLAERGLLRFAKTIDPDDRFSTTVALDQGRRKGVVLVRFCPVCGEDVGQAPDEETEGAHPAEVEGSTPGGRND